MELPKELPSMELEIQLDVEGNLTRSKYKGDFKFRIRNLKAIGQSGVYTARLNGSLDEGALEPSIAKLHYELGYLKTGLIEFPKWWEKADYGYNLDDYNAVSTLFNQCLAFEDQWVAKVWPKEEKAPDDISTEKGA